MMIRFTILNATGKKQQMRWTKKGAHLLLQIRTQVLNDDWHATIEWWYPGLAGTNPAEQRLAA